MWCIQISNLTYSSCDFSVLLLMWWQSKSGNFFSSRFLSFPFFLLDIFCIYISTVISFSSFPSKTSYPLQPPLLTNQPPPASWPWQDTILGHRTFTGPRASPPIDDHLDHPLLQTQLEPWVPPCVFLSWWFSPRELWRYWLVHIVVPPMRLQTPSAPWVLSLD